MAKIEMVCLANSRKLGRFCVAGVRTDGGGWVRPVSSTTGGALSRATTTTDRNLAVQILDVFEISVEGPAPLPHQPENWLLQAERWQHKDGMRLDDVPGIVPSTPGDGRLLLGSAGDRVLRSTLDERPIPRSLDAIEVLDVTWVRRLTQKGSRQIRSRFGWGGEDYDLAVTDPAWESRFDALPDGEYGQADIGLDPRDRCLLTVSLSEPMDNGYCFKLVAGVVTMTRPVSAMPGTQDDGETLSSISLGRFGVAFSGPGRFGQGGWTYRGTSDQRCPGCGGETHTARKPYESAGRTFRYYAILCSRCRRVWVPDDFGPDEKKQIYGSG